MKRWRRLSLRRSSSGGRGITLPAVRCFSRDRLRADRRARAEQGRDRPGDPGALRRRHRDGPARQEPGHRAAVEGVGPCAEGGPGGRGPRLLQRAGHQPARHRPGADRQPQGRRGVQQGGSTITQQYAKNAYLTQERTFTRKIKEVFIALKMSHTVSKDQILEDYLNTIYFGRGAYGIEAASETYFKTSACEPHPRAGGRAGQRHPLAGGLRPGAAPGARQGALELRARRHGEEGAG